MRICLQVLFLLIFSGGTIKAQQLPTKSFAFYSKLVGDSFDIFVAVGQLDPNAPIHFIYYLDAHINSGKELRRQLITGKIDLAGKAFVGVGHRGDFHEKRRRDFIPPCAKQLAGAVVGHADRFYQFLEQELLPAMEVHYGEAKQRSLIGHSFGGLFAVYALFRPQRLFDHYYALSPSLWVNQYDVLEREAAFFRSKQSLPVYFYLSAGGAERFNYILSGNRRLKALLEKRNYAGLKIDYQEYSGQTHNSQVPLSLWYILHTF